MLDWQATKTNYTNSKTPSMYPKELTQPIASPLQYKKGVLQLRKTLDELLVINQVSMLEVAIADFLQKVSLPFIYGLTLPNFEQPNRPYTLDFYIPRKATGLEIDSVWHDTDDYIKRDKKKTDIAKLIGLKHLRRYRPDFPQKLIYKDLKGDDRSDTRKIYETFKKGQIIEAVEPILNYPDVAEFQNPPIFENEKLFENYPDNIKSKK